MAPRIIVSYDDTDNDRDALALGRLLAFAGGELSLAYVRHSQGGALEEKEAEDLLARGAESVGAPDMPRHLIVNPGTSVGLAELAERENADVIVFGSEYRTANGIVKPGISAHKLLLGRRQHDRHPRRGRRSGGCDRRESRRGARRHGKRVQGPPGRSPGGRFAARVAAGQGHPQRLQRLRGRGGDLPGAGRPSRGDDPLRRGALRVGVARAWGTLGQRLGLFVTTMTAATSGSRLSSFFSTSPRETGCAA